MNSFKIVPQFRENCIIQGNQEVLSNFEIGDTIFLISNLPTKTFSIISKIEEINYSGDSKIYIDKRNLGKFADNDDVSILKYNPAEALEVYIDISSDYIAVSKGDWTIN
ncbi:MAG: hypothetical protein ACFE9S_20475, partial [Candidatus Hermodarchaeota archaeon]